MSLASQYMVPSGVYISENSTNYYLSHWAFWQKQAKKDTVEEWSEHKVKAIFELSPLEIPIWTPHLALSMNFKFLYFLSFFELSAKLGGQLAICCQCWAVIYAPGCVAFSMPTVVVVDFIDGRLVKSCSELNFRPIKLLLIVLFQK